MYHPTARSTSVANLSTRRCQSYAVYTCIDDGGTFALTILHLFHTFLRERKREAWSQPQIAF